MNLLPSLLPCALAALFTGAATAQTLDDGWSDPPRSARVRAYWWWLNGHVTRAAITRDLEEMQAKGWAGALICDAGGAEQDGNDRVPHGPTFLTPEWRALYRHALEEAGRLGLEMSLNIQSGWNLGGPMVPVEDAPKKLVWTETRITGPSPGSTVLPAPQAREGFYRDLFVLAWPARTNQPPPPLRNAREKALLTPLRPFSAPDSTPLFQELPDQPGEADTRTADVRDLTGRLDPDGTLRWEPPPGTWTVLRLGFTLNDHCRVSTSSDGWQGYALDPFDAGAFRRYWDQVVEPLIADAGPLAGRALKYLHTDSWEVEVANWTPSLREEFRRRRGYDLLPWLPVIAGRIVEGRTASNRFLEDFRRTIGDLAIDNHYRLFRDGAHRHGLEIHPESGGPHAVPIDAQQCLGFNDVPMSEFWAWSWRHRVGDANRFFVKQPASAAHTSGRRFVAAEGFTTIGPHWQETLWDNLKPAFDQALCEGLNRLFWHAVVCSPEEAGLPGIQYFAGTHFNPNTTWWPKSAPFVAWMNRSQWMLQQGLFVADVAWYYGDHVPNFARLKSSDPAGARPGHDYDVLSEEALLSRVSVRDGRLVLPDGMSYRLLVLPERTPFSLPALRKVAELVRAGALVSGLRPTRASGLTGFPASDAEVLRLADELWGPAEATPAGRTAGSPRVLPPRPAREILAGAGVLPDFECRPVEAGAPLALDWIHRRDAATDTDLYFVANRSNRVAVAECTFRVAGRAPELWNPVTGERTFARAYAERDGRTTLPVEFAPCGSWFVVFRAPTSEHPPTAPSNAPSFGRLAELPGPWRLHFPAGASAAEPNDAGLLKSSTREVVLESLRSWTELSEPGLRHHSGAASYFNTFDLPETSRSPDAAASGRLWLDLGDLRELAEIWLNGTNLGVVWAPPFRVDITEAVKPRDNRLQVEVVNFWPNRIIGDQSLPPERRFTRTNVRKLTADTPLMPSGLFGPVALLRESSPTAARTYRNPLIPDTLADPAVLRHDGTFYLYATGEVDGDNGTRVYTSTNLVDWQRGPVVFRPGRPHVWAPDVWRDPASGRFYLYYTVSETIGVAEADGPLGPFTVVRQFFDQAIDAHLFRDDDGKLFLYFVKFPGFRISVQPMASPTEPEGEPRVLLQPESGWETRAGRVTEGPWMIKHQGRYHLLYSGSGANTPDYAVGYAVADHPLGPFTRAAHNPIVHRGEGLYGPGHGCAIRDDAGNWWHLYHQKRSDRVAWDRFIALDRLWFDAQGRLQGRATRDTPGTAPVIHAPPHGHLPRPAALH